MTTVVEFPIERSVVVEIDGGIDQETGKMAWWVDLVWPDGARMCVSSIFASFSDAAVEAWKLEADGFRCRIAEGAHP